MKKMENKNKWTAVRISKEMGIYFQTVDKRFHSKYAKERWGVVAGKLPDGSIKRYVPEDKIHLWENPTNYVGRPVFE